MGGWTDGLLAAGWDVIGFDITQWPGYKGKLMQGDVRQVHHPRQQWHLVRFHQAEQRHRKLARLASAVQAPAGLRQSAVPGIFLLAFPVQKRPVKNSPKRTRPTPQFGAPVNASPPSATPPSDPGKRAQRPILDGQGRSQLREFLPMGRHPRAASRGQVPKRIWTSQGHRESKRSVGGIWRVELPIPRRQRPAEPQAHQWIPRRDGTSSASVPAGGGAARNRISPRAGM